MGAGVLSLLDISTLHGQLQGYWLPTGNSIVESGAMGLLEPTPKLILLLLHH